MSAERRECALLDSPSKSLGCAHHSEGGVEEGWVCPACLAAVNVVARKTNDRGHAKYRSGQFVPGVRVEVVEETYSNGTLLKGAVGTVADITNAGFRGIEATLRFEPFGRAYGINLDLLVLA